MICYAVISLIVSKEFCFMVIYDWSAVSIGVPQESITDDDVIIHTLAAGYNYANL